MSNQNTPPPEWAEYRQTVDELEAVYREHFPSSRLDYEWEAYWIHHTVWSTPWSAWKHADVLARLYDIKRALRFLRDYELPQMVNDTIYHDAFLRSEGFEGEFSPITAAQILPDLYDLLEPSIRAAEKVVSEGDQGKTNWDAVNAIDACRTSWWRCTGEAAPTSINEASPFGRFAQDIFNALGIKKKARPAIDAWRRVQRNAEKT